MNLHGRTIPPRGTVAQETAPAPRGGTKAGGRTPRAVRGAPGPRVRALREAAVGGTPSGRRRAAQKVTALLF